MLYFYIFQYFITHYTQSKPTMEVHHHPHVEKKGFKEYFLEFLMIFLAVTLGFFAENIREHFTESRRAHVLAESMLQDLKKDTAQLNENIIFRNKKEVYSDSVLSMLHLPKEQWNNTLFYT